MGAGASATIIAVSTPPGQGGVGLIRISGPQALLIGRQLFVARSVLGRRVRHVTLGRVVDDDGRPLDAALAWFLQGPSTYTGEDVVEISTHGSTAVLEAVVDRGLRLGARLAQAGEFTRRAFLNGRMDLLQAEAVADVIQAQSLGSLKTAYGVLGGQLSARVGRMRDGLVDALARLESVLDFSDDVAVEEVGNVAVAIAEVMEGATALMDSFRGARSRMVGFSVVLVGRPNAGKSTLFNSLLGEDRSIVTDVPGTTRDWVEGRANWAGETVRLIDTAGLRDTNDPVESAGVRRTQSQIEAADLVVQVIDSATELFQETESVCGPMTRIVRVYTKGDIEGTHTGRQQGDLVVSAHTGLGMVELREAILRELPRGGSTVDGGPVRERHRDALAAIVESTRRAQGEVLSGGPWELAAAELQNSLRHVGQLLGEEVDDAVLDRIFSEFCVGK
ncbi:MAG: tRNA uridine-5-carboxymethylaminomethyl(34) synthesis GTPase MnmE [bacterium]|nr:tRNA uridine-5-carboxymethylaminomethyl(34) synthesis GTPase MnmE [bacterium]